MNVVALVTDGFGGHGGIALHSRHMLQSVCDMPSVDNVVALPRVPPAEPYRLPEKLTYKASASEGIFRFLVHLVGCCFIRPAPQVVICSHIHLLPLAAVCKRLTGGKLILILHGIEAWTKPGKAWIDWSLRQTNSISAVSGVTIERFSKWSGIPMESITQIPNGIDLDLFGAGEKPAELEEKYGLADSKVLLTVGRLAAEEQAKGFDRIIELVPRLLEEIPDFRYLIVGSGSDRARLEKLALDLGIAHAVTFTGQVEESEKAAHFRLADAFAMPSTQEGFGYVFLEAMACGLPVIGSKTDGGRDALLNGELGILVDPLDPDQLYIAIVQALGQPKAVPEKLSYFSLTRFQSRFQKEITQTMNSATPGE